MSGVATDGDLVRDDTYRLAVLAAAANSPKDSEIRAAAVVIKDMSFIKRANWAAPVSSQLLRVILSLNAAPSPAGACARRMAEILDFHDLEGQAAGWWRCAASLGDPDAQDYVGTFIDPPDRS